MNPVSSRTLNWLTSAKPESGWSEYFSYSCSILNHNLFSESVQNWTRIGRESTTLTSPILPHFKWTVKHLWKSHLLSIELGMSQRVWNSWAELRPRDCGIHKTSHNIVVIYESNPRDSLWNLKTLTHTVAIVPQWLEGMKLVVEFMNLRSSMNDSLVYQTLYRGDQEDNL
jgi:hypothetical protein